LVSQSALSGSVQAGLEEMVKEYESKFGLDKPLWQQYLIYLVDVAHFDFNYSIANYPRKVVDMIADAIPWSVALLLVTTLLGFLIGNVLGALLAWPGAPGFLRYVMPPILMMSAIPYFLLGLILVYVFGFFLGIFPMYGGYTTGTIPVLTIGFMWDVLWHTMLPALSIILVSMGGWALGMRSLMVMTQGEDYVVFADAMGLRDRTIFGRYAIRNALLPQVTALALALGQIVSGAVLVEVIFGYPGIGTMLYQAIRGSDYYLVQGIVFIVIISIGLATFILDIIYPLLDPRITYRKA
jgi:peptide/nickel transport system permease protein